MTDTGAPTENMGLAKSSMEIAPTTMVTSRTTGNMELVRTNILRGQYTEASGLMIR